jgi:hypothetical protein
MQASRCSRPVGNALENELDEKRNKKQDVAVTKTQEQNNIIQNDT